MKDMFVFESHVHKHALINTVHLDLTALDIYLTPENTRGIYKLPGEEGRGVGVLAPNSGMDCDASPERGGSEVVGHL